MNEYEQGWADGSRMSAEIERLRAALYGLGEACHRLAHPDLASSVSFDECPAKPCTTVRAELAQGESASDEPNQHTEPQEAT